MRYDGFGDATVRLWCVDEMKGRQDTSLEGWSTMGIGEKERKLELGIYFLLFYFNIFYYS